MTTFFIPIVISTHAPRTGSDVRWDAKKYRYMRISTHAPRTGSDRHQTV